MKEKNLKKTRKTCLFNSTFKSTNCCLGHFDHCLFGDLVLHSLKLSVAVIALLAAIKRNLYLDDCAPLIRTRYGNLIRLGEN